MRALGAQRRVIAMARVHDGGIWIDVEHFRRHLAEETLEVAGLPGFADAARKYRRF